VFPKRSCEKEQRKESRERRRVARERMSMLSTTGLVDSIGLVKVLQVSNLCHHCTGEEVERNEEKVEHIESVMTLSTTG
jgi:hypothetical protein